MFTRSLVSTRDFSAECGWQVPSVPLDCFSVLPLRIPVLRMARQQLKTPAVRYDHRRESICCINYIGRRMLASP